MPDEHSLFSASGAEGWMVCHAKPLMERGRERTSEYADEGTAAHTLAQWVLEARLGLSDDRRDTTAADFIARSIPVVNGETKRVFTVDADMAEHVDTYVDAFMAMSQGKRVLRFPEKRLNYSRHLGVAEHLAWGTGDGIALVLDAPAAHWQDAEGETHHFPAGVELQVHDLKYGMGVRVFAPGNPQPRHYGLGALSEFELLAEITRVRMVIHQPRLDHISDELISVEDLLAWAKEPAAAAPKVIGVMEQFGPDWPVGGVQSYKAVPKALYPHLQPSEKGCRFCDGKAVCPALYGVAAEFATGGARSSPEDFADVSVDAPADVKGYGDNWLAMAADKLDLLDTLRKAVRAEIDDRVLRKGLQVPGFKIVEGAQGDRKWTDEAAAEKALAAMRVGEAAYKKKVISPTQAEKLLKKTSPHFASLQPLITRSPGAPSVVRDSDPRAAFAGHKASADDFEDVTEARGVAQVNQSHPFR